MPQKSREVDLVKEKILTYFRDHPNAADSLEGIAKFWLSDLDTAFSQEELKDILEQLVDDGVVRKSNRNIGGAIYSSAFGNLDS